MSDYTPSLVVLLGKTALKQLQVSVVGSLGMLRSYGVCRESVLCSVISYLCRILSARLSFLTSLFLYNCVTLHGTCYHRRREPHERTIGRNIWTRGRHSCRHIDTLPKYPRALSTRTHCLFFMYKCSTYQWHHNIIHTQPKRPNKYRNIQLVFTYYH